MRLVHTLLFFIRQETIEQDLSLASACLRSLEKSAHKTVIVYNQGFWSNAQLEAFLSCFALDCVVVGSGTNDGTSVGRQSCFESVFMRFPEAEYVSELHLDMLFTRNWEKPLIEYLDTHDEPLICCGILDKAGSLHFLNKTVQPLPGDPLLIDETLQSLREDTIVRGFTNPCIHKVTVLKECGGYNASFLKGKQCFEDDSMLLGYYYYYGTRANWHPKVNYNSVVYHAVAGQRLNVQGNTWDNFNGLVRQYGAMGLKHLSTLHTSPWHINFFTEQYANLSR